VAVSAQRVRLGGHGTVHGGAARTLGGELELRDGELGDIRPWWSAGPPEPLDRKVHLPGPTLEVSRGDIPKL
jgi:hypothetical protein